jgi:polysaccharide biosynthesis/export protein
MRRVSSIGRVLVAFGAAVLLGQDGVVRLPSGPPQPAPQAPSPQGPDDQVKTSSSSSQPLAPSGMADGMPPVNPSTFKVGAEDVLDITVWREPQLSGQVVVRPDGRVTANLVGEIEVGGKTIEEITKILTTKYGEVLNEPVVFVQPRSIRSSKYYVTGFVPRPGMYQLVVDTTVLDALIMAGGISEIANPKKIMILRNNKDRIFFNYSDVSKGKKLEQNILLQNGDRVFVN